MLGMAAKDAPTLAQADGRCSGALPEVLLAGLIGAWRVEQLQADVCLLGVQGGDGRLQQQGLLVRLGVRARAHLAVEDPQCVVCGRTGL